MVVWNGDAARIAAAGGSGVLAIDVFEREGELWRRSTARHVHRHHPVDDVLGALAACGLRARRAARRRPGGRLEPYAGESAHPKAMVIATRKEAGMPFRP